MTWTDSQQQYLRIRRNGYKAVYLSGLVLWMLGSVLAGWLLSPGVGYAFLVVALAWLVVGFYAYVGLTEKWAEHAAHNL